jgi:NhaP-type Na+/H+ or K+/H+ antiporter
VLAHKITLPYPIVLVVGGLALSFVPRLPVVNLNPDVVFYFILPALIYPAALFTSWRDFRRNLRPILLLAIGLVLATMFAVAWIAHSIVPALPWAAAFALGAIVSPPDAVAATAIIRRLGVPHRIQMILEDESLVTDATTLVALQFAIAAFVTGTFWEARRRIVSSGPHRTAVAAVAGKCLDRCSVRLQRYWWHVASPS